MTTLTMGLRDICMTAAEQQDLANYVNSQIQQTAVIFLGIGIVIGMIAPIVYIWLNNRYANQ